MRDSIKYSAGVSGLAGSLGGEAESILSSGFSDETPPKFDPWDLNPDAPRCDDMGNTSVGNEWEHRSVGAAGRPTGNER